MCVSFMLTAAAILVYSMHFAHVFDSEIGAAPGADSRGQHQQQQHPDLVTASGRNETLRWRVESSAGASPLETYSRLLLDKADPHYNGLYECEVIASGADLAAPLDHGHPQRAPVGEQLRRLFGLLVNGK